jgi:REP element-mobilizing transposase RayT
MHERRFKQPLRYKGHDYRALCSVHVTICTHMRQPLFGDMMHTGMLLSDAGQFVENALLRLHAPKAGIEIDTHVVMPDHLHAFIHLGTHPGVIPTCSISDLIRIFKMRVLKSWPGGIRNQGWPRYDIYLWQPSFHDTLIRNEQHLDITRAYILANPARWIERMESQAGTIGETHP